MAAAVLNKRLKRRLRFFQWAASVFVVAGGRACTAMAVAAAHTNVLQLWSGGGGMYGLIWDCYSSRAFEASAAPCCGSMHCICLPASGQGNMQAGRQLLVGSSAPSVSHYLHPIRPDLALVCALPSLQLASQPAHPHCAVCRRRRPRWQHCEGALQLGQPGLLAGLLHHSCGHRGTGVLGGSHLACA